MMKVKKKNEQTKAFIDHELMLLLVGGEIDGGRKVKCKKNMHKQNVSDDPK